MRLGSGRSCFVPANRELAPPHQAASGPAAKLDQVTIAENYADDPAKQKDQQIDPVIFNGVEGPQAAAGDKEQGGKPGNLQYNKKHQEIFKRVKYALQLVKN